MYIYIYIIYFVYFNKNPVPILSPFSKHDIDSLQYFALPLIFTIIDSSLICLIILPINIYPVVPINCLCCPTLIFFLYNQY